MEIYTMTYVSLYGGQLWTETNIYNNREEWEKAYKENILDIADNINNDEEKERFLKEFVSKLDWNAHWENWDGTEMYILKTQSHHTEYRDDLWDEK